MILSKELQEELTPEAFLDWERHPVTLALKSGLQHEVDEVLHRWLYGELDRNPDARGRAAGYQSLIEMSYEDLKELVND